MKRKQYSFIALFVTLTLLLAFVSGGMPPSTAQSQQASPAVPASVSDRGQVTQALRSSPIMFIENVGQFDPRARFQVRGGSGTMWLAEDAIWITVLEKPSSPQPPSPNLGEGGAILPSLRFGRGVGGEGQPRRGVNLRLTFPGTNPHPRLEPFDRLDTVVSYFIGNDPDQWHSNVPVWGGVRYVDLYPGVDLEVTSEGGHWAWRFAVRDSQFAISNVRLRVEGANDLILDDAGCLRLTTAIGDFTLPLLWVVEHAGTLHDLTSVWPQVSDTEVLSPFFLSPHPSFPLSSPSSQDNPDDLLYSTFLGGSEVDVGWAIAMDGTGSIYVTGPTGSFDFPTTAGAFDTNRNGNHDVFMVKLNAGGTGLAYATFLGGKGDDCYYSTGSGKACDIAVDGAGSVYVTGETSSSDFPTTSGAFDTNYNGGNRDAFVVKLNADGTGLAYATFVGGNSWDWGRAIAVDGTGSAYMTGTTTSSNFPTTAGAFNTSLNGGGDVFVVKLNAGGTGLTYATFLGGDNWDSGFAIAVDGAGSVYVTGRTDSSDFPTTAGAFDTGHNGGVWDAFVVKLNAGGTGLTYATFLGGSNQDIGFAIAVDGAGSAYIVGDTYSSNFPTTMEAFDISFNGGDWDAFVVKLDAGGTGLAYATFLGGSDNDGGDAIAVDGAGSAYATGETSSSDFPTTAGAFDTSYNGGDWDVFVVKLNVDGTVLAYATFLGGSDSDWGEAIAVGGAGSAYVTGNIYSSDFPITVGAYDTSHNGSRDAFVTKLAMGGGVDTTPPADVTDLASAPGPSAEQVTLIWKAPGDDGSGGGPATQYDIRYSSTPINDSNWASATQVSGEPTPGSPGSDQQMTVSGLATGTCWYFAMKTADEVPNWSGLSNVPSLQDIGFRPNPHGYSFPNRDPGWGKYPFPPANGDYTINDMRRMFGDHVVCHMVAGHCIPKFDAIIYNVVLNWELNGGHCDGMAATSLRFFKGLGDEDENEPSDFQDGADITHDLHLANVRRHIVYYHVKQACPPIKQEKMRRQTPKAILNGLRQAMSGDVPDPMNLYLLKGRGGHTVTPYAIEERGNGVYWVHVYDNEKPDKMDLVIEINTITDTWNGNADLSIVPISMYDEQAIPPWSESSLTLTGSSSGEVWLTGQGRLLITDSQGQRIGYVGDQFVKEIPGAYESIFVGGAGVEMEPIYTLPLSDTYTILLDGQTLTQTETVAVTQFGPGYAVEVDDIALEPASQDQFEVASDGTQLAYLPSDDKEVTLTLALDGASESNQLQINGADIGAGQAVTLTADVGNGQLVFNNAQASGGEYNLEVRRVSAAGQQIFVHTDLVISATDTHYADYGAWEGSGPMTVYVDHSSDGTIDETLVLENQVRRVYLPLILLNR